MLELKSIEIIKEKLNYFKDSDLFFDEKSHTFFYKGEKFSSVTQFISRFHKPFDKEFFSKKKAIERGVSVEEILLEWKMKNERSNNIGSFVHKWIENYYKKIWTELPTDTDIIQRINKFNILYAKELNKLHPIDFEIKIFSPRYKIAGIIDSLFFYRDSLVIVDWKTNEKFHTDDDLQGRYEKLLYPFESYYKNHLNEYSIQLSLYKVLLMEIGLMVKKCFIVYIGHEKENIYQCVDFSNLLYEYLNREEK